MMCIFYYLIFLLVIKKNIMFERTWLISLFFLGMSVILLINLKPKESNIFTQFEQFKYHYNKQYQSKQDESYRMRIFVQNLIKIQNHNQNKTNTFKLGINQFADLTQEEFIHIYLNNQILPKQTILIPQEKQQNDNKVIKQQSDGKTQIHNYGDIDWQSQGHVSVVKNQGSCASSWAFSAIAAIQSAYSIFKQQTILFSEQQLIDCSRPYGNNGCEGGRMDYSFYYIKDHGISTQSQYPYAVRAQLCRKNQGNYKIIGFVAATDCSNLYNALHQRPVSVPVDASNWALYREGVLSLCGNYVNHGVLVVGVTQSYWKIKNSWGINWGEDGYIRISKGNTCGVCSYPTYPLL